MYVYNKENNHLWGAALIEICLQSYIDLQEQWSKDANGHTQKE